MTDALSSPCEPSVPQTKRRLYRPEHIELRPALFPGDYGFLYQLLRERYGKSSANIPGMAKPKLPSYAEHVRHLDRTAYDRIEIIGIDGKDAGLMYLTADRVGGCFVLDAYAGRGVALSACFRFFSNERYPITAHFNARNRAGYRTADRLGWTLVRRETHRLTYELQGPPVDPFGKVRGR